MYFENINSKSTKEIDLSGKIYKQDVVLNFYSEKYQFYDGEWYIKQTISKCK